VGKSPAFEKFGPAISRIIGDPNIPEATDKASAVRWLVYRTKLFGSQLNEATEKLYPKTYLHNDRFNDELKDPRKPDTTEMDNVKRRRA
jgi:hypothetical protein